MWLPFLIFWLPLLLVLFTATRALDNLYTWTVLNPGATGNALSMFYEVTRF